MQLAELMAASDVAGDVSGVPKSDTRPNGDERGGDSGTSDLDSLRRR